MNGVMLARQVGVTYRQVDFWCRNGWLKPTNPGPGSGTWREFSSAEAEIEKRMACLVRAGVMPAAAARMVRGDRDASTALWVSLLELVSPLGVRVGLAGPMAPAGPFGDREGEAGKRAVNKLTRLAIEVQECR